MIILKTDRPFTPLIDHRRGGHNQLRFKHLSFRHLNKFHPETQLEWGTHILQVEKAWFVLQTSVDNATSKRSVILTVMQMKLLQPAWELAVLTEGVFGCPCTANRFTVASVSVPGKLILVSEMCKGSYHGGDWTGIHRSEEKKLSPEYFNLSLNTLALSPGSSQVLQHLSSKTVQDGFDRKLHPVSSETSQNKKKKNHKNNEPSKQMKKKADLKTSKEKYQTKQNSCAANNT